MTRAFEVTSVFAYLVVPKGILPLFACRFSYFWPTQLLHMTMKQDDAGPLQICPIWWFMCNSRARYDYNSQLHVDIVSLRDTIDIIICASFVDELLT